MSYQAVRTANAKALRYEQTQRIQEFKASEASSGTRWEEQKEAKQAILEGIAFYCKGNPKPVGNTVAFMDSMPHTI